MLDTCRIILVVIGPEWLTVKSDSGGRRIDDPRDHVRIEIETALAHEDLLVIPLLVRDATFPSPEDLPSAIEALAYRHGPSIRRDPDFGTDMGRLIRQMRRALEQSPAPVSHPPPPSPISNRTPGTTPTAKWILAAFILILFVLGGVFLVKKQQKHPSSPIVVASTPKPVKTPATPSAVMPEPAHSPSVRGPVPGKPWENSLGMRFVPVPGTEVLFSVWETRVRDFEAFVEATGYDATGGAYTLGSTDEAIRGGSWKNPRFDQTGDHPVVCVSWEDAQAFCGWLTGKERKAGRIGVGQKYRLPTDHEWSCAVGIGTQENSGQTPEEKNAKIQGVYPWGKDWPPPVGAGNYAGSEAKTKDWPSKMGTISGYDDGYPRTSPVGSFNRNRLGVYDLGGNVWEWCEDKYKASKLWRVLRGASWSLSGPGALLSSRRGFDAPGARGDDFGFRCVVVLESSR